MFKRCVKVLRMVPGKKLMKIRQGQRKRAREQLEASDGRGLEKQLKTN